jgi:DNA-binding response OmpR family regulator
MKILVIEDDAQLASALSARIKDAGYVVDLARTAEEGEAAIRSYRYELVVLDRRLPDGDGLAQIPGFRQAAPDVRIIVLTALDATIDKVSGLDAGADDYLTKPFETDELIARIRAALRRPGGAPQPVIRCANLCYQPTERSFSVDDCPIILKRREQLILETLILRARRVVRRDVFMDQVYGFDEEIQSNTLDAQISRLRARLVELRAAVRIHSVRGVGYMLTEQAKP